MSTVSICAPSRAHATATSIVMSSCAVCSTSASSASGQRVGEALAQRARQRGGVVERHLLAVQRVPDLLGAVARLAPLGEERVELGAARAVAGGHDARRSRRPDLAPVRAVGAMGDEPERAVQADRGRVVGVDEEHADGDAASASDSSPAMVSARPSPRPCRLGSTPIT